MKKLAITYHMLRGTEEDETCIVLPLADDRAAELLERQDRSRLLSGRGYSKGLLATTLDRLAKLQGYSCAAFILAEDVRKKYTD